ERLAMAVAGGGEPVDGEGAEHGARAEKTEVGTLLVGKRDHLERTPRRPARLLQAAGAFEASEDAETAVEPAAGGDGVDMRAADDGRPAGRAEPADHVAGGIDAGGKPGLGHPRDQPAARLDECRGKGRPVDAAVRPASEAREFLQLREEPVAINGDARPAAVHALMTISRGSFEKRSHPVSVTTMVSENPIPYSRYFRHSGGMWKVMPGTSSRSSPWRSEMISPSPQSGG